ncbi:hypothetical protein BBW65_01415 [Helicobacter enhydrae]|uniref:Periplasmic protein n=2 Tax=Helicobacter enhydrae TaxID=222136 RepID=A0A1B1U443_9HELI|nr:hypothetical protein BBW65_01415 [Helicobacter enhydrae]
MCVFFAFLYASEAPKIHKMRELNHQEIRVLKESQTTQQGSADKKPQKIIRGSTHLQESQGKSPYEGMDNRPKDTTRQIQEEYVQNQSWLYGTSVITTIFLDGSIKRSYGILLRDGIFLTSANMVYSEEIYARASYAMMQDDSSIPFVCVAQLSIKALDLQRGLAILETSAYTDTYCNPRPKSYYHDRLYSKYWIDVFDNVLTPQGVVYSPTISELNSFMSKRTIVENEDLNKLTMLETNDFKGYKYSYGKGFYTRDGKLIGILASDLNGGPKFVQADDIAHFMCELQDKKILQKDYLTPLCANLKEHQHSES